LNTEKSLDSLPPIDEPTSDQLVFFTGGLPLVSETLYLCFYGFNHRFGRQKLTLDGLELALAFADVFLGGLYRPVLRPYGEDSRS